ncbi:hypothetical protein [Lysobacter enzymogenes]|uniref:hypothetical protein n=1 Tax=Lysobacter enzymogenes TaxID=69 RepID=UPI000F4B82CE|nr:hypothetical protein [Lysobacter enzymogenes]
MTGHAYRPHRRRARFTLPAALTLLLFAAATNAAPAAPARSASDWQAGCNQPWTYTVASLQNARKQLKDGDYPNIDRVACGTRILARLGPQNIDDACPQCRNEYVGLLIDHAFYQNLAGNDTTNPEYWQEEISTRKQVDRLLLDQPLESIAKRWKDNFENLGDRLELLHRAHDYHRLAENAPALTMSDKSVRLWIKAVRSCSSWDFVSSEKKSDALIGKTLACQSTCGAAASSVRDRIASGTVAAPAQMLLTANRQLPDLPCSGNDAGPGGNVVAGSADAQ